jgi:hypothetical protein
MIRWGTRTKNATTLGLSFLIGISLGSYAHSFLRACWWDGWLLRASFPFLPPLSKVNSGTRAKKYASCPTRISRLGMAVFIRLAYSIGCGDGGQVAFFRMIVVHGGGVFMRAFVSWTV